LVELQRTGEWRYNYEETEFLELMCEALAWAQTWRELAPGPQDAEVAGAGLAAPARQVLP
jgi:hypothetical protein